MVAQPWSPAWVIYPVWVAGGCGMGLAMSSLSVLLLSFSPPAERGVNSSALQLSDSVASALCIGLAGALVAASARGLLPLEPGGRRAGPAHASSSRWPAPCWPAGPAALSRASAPRTAPARRADQRRLASAGRRGWPSGAG